MQVIRKERFPFSCPFGHYNVDSMAATENVETPAFDERGFTNQRGAFDEPIGLVRWTNVTQRREKLADL